MSESRLYHHGSINFFKETQVVLDLEALAGVKTLDHVLKKFKKCGVKFTQINKQYIASGLWDDLCHLNTTLQKLENPIAETANAAVINSDFVDFAQEIEHFVNGEEWVPETVRSGNSLKNKRYNTVKLCYVIGHNLAEIKAYGQVLKFKSADGKREHIDEVRLSLKGNDKDINRLIDLLDEKMRELEDGYFAKTIKLKEIKDETLNFMLNELENNITPLLTLVGKDKLHVLIKSDMKDEVLMLFENMESSAASDIGTDPVQVLQSLFDKPDPPVSKQNGHFHDVLQQSVTALGASDIGDLNNHKSESNRAIESMDTDHETPTHRNLNTKYLTGDPEIIRYIFEFDNEKIKSLETKYHVVIDNSELLDGKICLVADGDDGVKYLDAAYDDIAREIQNLHFDLCCERIDISSVLEPWAKNKNDLYTEARHYKIEIQKTDANSSICIVGAKENVSAFTKRIKDMLFPTVRAKKRERILITDGASTSLRNSLHSDSGTSQKRERILSSGDASTSFRNLSHSDSGSLSPTFNNFWTGNSIQWNGPKLKPVAYSHSASGVTVQCEVTDITKLEVDAIVNAANEELGNFGGVALAISKAGGFFFDVACSDYIKQNGHIKVTGNCVTKGGGALMAKNVIHAVGPRWSSSLSIECIQELRSTFLNIFPTVTHHNFRSIALPSISSGIFGMPQHLVAEVMVSAVCDYLESGKKSTLKHILLVDVDHFMISLIKEQLQQKANANILYQSVPVEMSGAKPAKRERKLAHSLSSPGSSQDPTNNDTRNDNLNYHTPQSAENTGAHESTNSTVNNTNEDNRKDNEPDDCCICMCPITNPKTLKCKHTFCTECIDRGFEVKPVCPICGAILGTLTGNQPPGNMDVSNHGGSLPGHSDCGTIVINYNIPNGTQTEEHPNPGQMYYGVGRTGYLPDNNKGRQVVQLLRKAFENRLIFTVGRSVTSGQDNVVTWNDIHHKTNPSGGAQGYGYPDPEYLDRVLEELATKGLK